MTGLSFIAAVDLERKQLDLATKELVADLRFAQIKAMNQGKAGPEMYFHSRNDQPFGYYINIGGETILEKNMPDKVSLFSAEHEPLRFGTHGFPQNGRRIILRCGKYSNQIVIDFVGRIRIMEMEG